MRVTSYPPVFWICLLIAAGFPVVSQAQTSNCSVSLQPPQFEAAHPAAAGAAHTGGHGQLFFGEGPYFLSHLAVFMGDPERHPHNFQVILEAAFSDPATEATYLESDRANPGEIHTALPPVFDQTALVTDEPGQPPLRVFPETSLFLGHFEQGGKMVAPPTDLDLNRIVYYREFATDALRLDHPQYILFGGSEEMFLSNLISAPPDFQQVLRVEFTGEGNSADLLPAQIDQLLSNGLFLTMRERSNTVAERLRPEETLVCDVDAGTPLPLATLGVRVLDEVYCEEGELSALVMSAFNRAERCAP